MTRCVAAAAVAAVIGTVAAAPHVARGQIPAQIPAQAPEQMPEQAPAGTPAARPVGAAAESREALPGWRIATVCANESAAASCVDFEARARNAVRASWSFVLDPIKQTCLGQARLPADQSWRLLAACIDTETLKDLDKAAVRTAKTPAEPSPAPRAPAAAPSEPPMATSPSAPNRQ